MKTRALVVMIFFIDRQHNGYASMNGDTGICRNRQKPLLQHDKSSVQSRWLGQIGDISSLRKVPKWNAN